jgi:hypothetical protein
MEGPLFASESQILQVISFCHVMQQPFNSEKVLITLCAEKNENNNNDHPRVRESLSSYMFCSIVLILECI